MQSTQSPTLMPLPFASAGGRNTIPEASQLPGSPGSASYTDGFPPATRTLVAAGGIPPSGLDMNGILYAITQSIRWAHAGGRYTWNSAFTNDANVAGYPNGATLMRADLTGFWINTADNNATNPDATDGSAANWVPGYNYGITPITGLTNTNVTLTPAQAAKSKITLAGNLTGNVQIVFPAWTKEWTVVNNTTGAFTVTAKTTSGTGVALAAGQQKITGDGTNITQPAESIAPATASQHAVQLGQVAGVVGSARNVVMSVTTASASATLTADEIVVETALGGLRYCLANFNKTINLATTGAGGMDTGAAPASGFVAIYAIWNPATQTAALLAQNASTLKGNVYGGANMPAGYTASALVGVWATNGSGQFQVGYQVDRKVWTQQNTVLNTSTQQTSYTSLSLSAVVPVNAKSVWGTYNLGSSAVTNTAASIASSSAGLASIGIDGVVASSGESIATGFPEIPLVTSQTIYYTAQVGAGTMSWQVGISGYSF